MRFCQVDGTPLVDDAPAFDPYATVIAQPATPTVEPTSDEVVEDVAETAPDAKPAEDESGVHQTVGSVPIAPPDDVLDLPLSDPLKTVYVSEDEMKDALGADDHTADVVELPPLGDLPPPPPPSFIAPEIESSDFGKMAPPPSPFSDSGHSDEPVLAPPVFLEPETSAQDVDTVIPPEVAAALNQPSAPVAAWTPPPAPDAAWQNQEIGSNTPFQPPPSGTGSINQTLPIISLVLGIVSLCCYISPITGIAALITGYLGMKNANNDPANYGGKGLAIAGMITGGLFLLVGVAYYVIVILIYAGVIAGSMLQGF